MIQNLVKEFLKNVDLMRNVVFYNKFSILVPINFSPISNWVDFCENLVQQFLKGVELMRNLINEIFDNKCLTLESINFTPFSFHSKMFPPRPWGQHKGNILVQNRKSD